MLVGNYEEVNYYKEQFLQVGNYGRFFFPCCTRRCFVIFDLKFHILGLIMFYWSFYSQYLEILNRQNSSTLL